MVDRFLRFRKDYSIFVEEFCSTNYLVVYFWV
jgi:hypothetical protein